MNCQLVLQNYNGPYAPGETIIGIIKCVYIRSEHVQGVKVRLKGKESTEWIENVDQYDRKTDAVKSTAVKHFGINRIVEAEQIVTTAGFTGPGSYEYLFRMVLPRQLPNTYKCPNGEIQYKLHATVEFSGGQYNRDTTEIVLYSPVNVNHIPINEQPTPNSDVKTATGFFGTRKAQLDVFLSQKTYLIGESIKVTVIIKNNFVADIKNVHLKLIRINTETVNVPEVVKRSNRELIDEKRAGGVNVTFEKTYYFEFIVLNPALLHNLLDCKLFKEEFVLEVTGQFGGFYENLMVEVPVYIGHTATPLRVTDGSTTKPDSSMPYLPTEYQVCGPSAPMAHAPSAPPLHDYTLIATTSQPNVDRRDDVPPEDPPPSYSEAMNNPTVFPRPS